MFTEVCRFAKALGVPPDDSFGTIATMQGPRYAVMGRIEATPAGWSITLAPKDAAAVYSMAADVAAVGQYDGWQEGGCWETNGTSAFLLPAQVDAAISIIEKAKQQ